MIDQSRDASAVSLSESKSSQDSGRPACLSVIPALITAWGIVPGCKSHSRLLDMVFFIYLSKRSSHINFQRNSWKVSNCAGVFVWEFSFFGFFWGRLSESDESSSKFTVRGSARRCSARIHLNRKIDHSVICVYFKRSLFATGKNKFTYPRLELPLHRR